MRKNTRVNIHSNKKTMPVFDNLKCVFFIAKMLEQNINVQLTFDEYRKYLNVWNQLDDTTRELYTIYANMETPSVYIKKEIVHQ
jgi:hypothetical protein